MDQSTQWNSFISQQNIPYLQAAGPPRGPPAPAIDYPESDTYQAWMVLGITTKWKAESISLFLTYKKLHVPTDLEIQAVLNEEMDRKVRAKKIRKYEARRQRY
jgi:hypothetical protein